MMMMMTMIIMVVIVMIIIMMMIVSEDSIDKNFWVRMMILGMCEMMVMIVRNSLMRVRNENGDNSN